MDMRLKWHGNYRQLVLISFLSFAVFFFIISLSDSLHLPTNLLIIWEWHLVLTNSLTLARFAILYLL